MNKFKKYKNRFKSLLSEETSEEDYELAISSIEKRVERIWNYICKTSSRNLIWWSFRNDVESSNGEATTGGTFDPIEDSKFVKIKGCFSEIKNPNYPYNEGFPTKLIWDKKWKSKIKRRKITLKVHKNEDLKLLKDFSNLLKKNKNN
ncbi:MAG: hypothetical protein EKK64_10190 [Neisseriaceae bacterium]|nr:MAG: hypothetical protein EKK64_10190 [Neisseriaceae bacterium]